MPTTFSSDSHFMKTETSNLARLLNCVAEIKHWMADNFLQLNPDKTEVLIIAPDNLVPDIMQHIGPLSSSVCPVVRSLGVLFAHSLSFNTHIKPLVKSWFFHLHNISQLRAVVSHAVMEILIQSFISSVVITQ